MRHIYKWGCGKTATFALMLFVSGVLLAVFHRLDASFVGLAGVIQALITFRAVSDDHKQKRDNWHTEETKGATT